LVSFVDAEVVAAHLAGQAVRKWACDNNEKYALHSIRPWHLSETTALLPHERSPEKNL